MKKETVNTFTGGMNKDLNPLVTPNDILTDALNAQMLTFNGDELSLQTDAGNTKIKVGNDYVKLTEGFHPLGIKEYGGVLYIVSGKNKVGDNPAMIEFGSYPSPEFAADKDMPGVGALLTNNNIYRSFVINNNDFKTGRRIKFTSSGDLSNLKHVDSNNLEVNKIYHVRLLHQLESGMLDLTNDIWDKFKEHKSSTLDPATHWLTSETFSYYCPTQYKGKLQLQVILDEPGYFQLNHSPEHLERSEVNPNDRPELMSSYSGGLKFNLSWQNSEHIYLHSYKITLSFSDLRPDLTEVILAPSGSATPSSEVIIKIPYKQSSSVELYNVVEYTITPIWAHTGGTIDENELPSDFINKYKIKGIRLLESKFNEVYFELSDSRCSGNGLMVYSKAVLRNRDNKLDTSLNPTNLEYVFIHETAQVENYMRVLGKYKVVGNKPSINEETTQNMIDLRNQLNDVQEELYNHLATQFQETDVQLPNSSCSQFILKFKFNMALGLVSPSELSEDYNLTFTQPRVSKDSIPFITLDGGRTFEIKIDAIEDVVINFSHRFDSGLGTRQPSGVRSQGVILKKENLFHNHTYNIAWITQLKSRDIVRYVYDSGGASGRTPDKVSEFNYNTLDIQNSLLGEYIKVNNLFTIDPPSGKTMDIMYNTNYQTLYVKMSPAIEYESISGNSVSFPFTITSGVNVNADEFLNISDYENYVKIGDFSNSDMGFIVVKKRDACWINKVDIYSGDDPGTNRGGRSSTPRTSSSNN